MADRHVTQTALAAALNLSQAGVSRRLTGSVDFTVTELHTTAALLEVEPAVLLGAIDAPVHAAAG